MKKIIKIIKDSGVNLDLISPNYVADIAYNLGISLTSEQIVRISDKIK